VNKLIRLCMACLPLCSFVFVKGLSAQTVRKSSEDCDKVGPRTWKGASFEERREEEDTYWACRVHVPTETIKLWEQASEALDPIASIEIRHLQKQQMVFIERMGGTMHCFSFAALQKTSGGWTKIWEESGEEYCRDKCPDIEMRISSLRISLEIPKSVNKDCEGAFQKREFVWDGKTFRRVAKKKQRLVGTERVTTNSVCDGTQKTSTIPGFPGGPTNYNANDQLSTDTYDNNGNTTASNGLGYVAACPERL